LKSSVNKLLLCSLALLAASSSLCARPYGEWRVLEITPRIEKEFSLKYATFSGMSWPKGWSTFTTAPPLEIYCQGEFVNLSFANYPPLPTTPLPEVKIQLGKIHALQPSSIELFGSDNKLALYRFESQFLISGDLLKEVEKGGDIHVKFGSEDLVYHAAPASLRAAFAKKCRSLLHAVQ